MLLFTARIAAASIPVAFALLTTSCSLFGDDNHSSTHADEPVITGEPAAFTEDDMNFANNAIACLQQALEMVQQPANHSGNPQIVTFAGENASSLQSDMQILKALRAQWHGGQDEAGTSDPGGASHGALDDATISKLDTLHGKAFDALWLNSMINLDQAVIRLSDVEISTGKNADAVITAEQITQTTQMDVARLKQMAPR